MASANLCEFLRSCIGFYHSHKQVLWSTQIQQRRQQLAVHVQRFHQQAGTLTPSVLAKIAALQEGTPVVVMTAHQPNFFAYSGVFRKATLSYVIQQELERLLQTGAVHFFGIADQDFTDDRWVRTAQLPSLQRRQGVVTLRKELPPKLMLKEAPKPSQNELDTWKQQVKNWLTTYKSFDHRTLQNLLEITLTKLSVILSKLQTNFENFWKLVVSAHHRSTNYADFNAYLLSLIINRVWNYDTLFTRFSDCQRIFTNEFESLCARSRKYYHAYEEAKSIARGIPLSLSHAQVSSVHAAILAPFWYHCECGGKAQLSISFSNHETYARGPCLLCHREYVFSLGPQDYPNLENLRNRISARAIPMPLIFFKGLGIISYVGGIGGKQYLATAQHIAKSLKWPFPPIAYWRPFDRYVGIAQVESIVESQRIRHKYNVKDNSNASQHIQTQLSRMNKEITLLEQEKQLLIQQLNTTQDRRQIINRIRTLATTSTQLKRECNLLKLDLSLINNISHLDDMIPSIIDYAVNVGLKSTSTQWVTYLLQNGDFTSDVPLKSLWTTNDH